MELNIYNIMWMFVIYSFLGWVCEVVFAVLVTGKFVNRGFLNGPACPIYGFGVVTVTVLLKPFYNNLFFLFIASVFLTSLLEFLTGYILEKIFSQKWWDYSDHPYNIKGYVCLRFSLLWGVACVVVIKVIHFVILKPFNLLPQTLGIILLIFVSTFFITDLVLTVISLAHIKKFMHRVNDIEEKMRTLSDKLGEKITTGVINAKELQGESEKKYVLLKEKYEQLSKNYMELMGKKIMGHTRISSAFPKLKLRTSDSLILKLRQSYEELKNKIQINK